MPTLASTTYRAAQAASPEKLQLLGSPGMEPKPGEAGTRGRGMRRPPRAQGRCSWSPVPTEISLVDLRFGNHIGAGWVTGDPATGGATLRLSTLAGIAAIVESVARGALIIETPGGDSLGGVVAAWRALLRSLPGNG